MKDLGLALSRVSKMNTFPLELPQSDLRLIEEYVDDDDHQDAAGGFLKVKKEAGDDATQAIKALRRASLALISKKN